MQLTPSQLAFTFSSVGHFFFHYFVAMYFTIVVAMARSWTNPYHELIELWTPGFLLVGLAALPAGKLADRWSAPPLLVIMFIGMGLTTILCGFMTTTTGMMIALAGLGLAASIYHPVGLPWLIRTSSGSTGKKLALNGLFGGVGSAAAGALTGLILVIGNWQSAFIVPGLVCLGCGLLMGWYTLRGRFEVGSTAQSDTVSSHGRSNRNAFLLMLFPLFSMGLIYNAMQGMLPKLLEEQAAFLLQGNLALIGSLVGVVYGIAALMQLVGGWLADRYDLKRVYWYGWMTQPPLLLLITVTENMTLIVITVILVACHTAAMPSENLMLSRFSPRDKQGMAFGIKFVLTFGAGPLAVEMISLAREYYGDFDPLVLGLLAVSLVTVLVISFLPSRTERIRGNVQASEA